MNFCAQLLQTLTCNEIFIVVFVLKIAQTLTLLYCTKMISFSSSMVDTI